MSAKTSRSQTHLIAISLSAAGRFLVCRECDLRLEFPSGAHYDILAKEFDSRECGCPSPSKDAALSTRIITDEDSTTAAPHRLDVDDSSTMGLGAWANEL
jgi:hypothetical protein